MNPARGIWGIWVIAYFVSLGYFAYSAYLAHVRFFNLKHVPMIGHLNNVLGVTQEPVQPPWTLVRHRPNGKYRGLPQVLSLRLQSKSNVYLIYVSAVPREPSNLFNHDNTEPTITN